MANDQTSGPAVRVIDLTGLRLDELRTSRRELEAEENELSYVRRLLQGRIDIIRAELSRRSGHGTDVLSSLPAILADAPSASKGQNRFVSVDQPAKLHAAAIEAQKAANELSSSNLCEMSEPQLRTSLATLQRNERRVSQARAQIHTKMNRMSAELTRRYREGSAQVDDLLAAARRK